MHCAMRAPIYFYENALPTCLLLLNQDCNIPTVQYYCIHQSLVKLLIPPPICIIQLYIYFYFILFLNKTWFYLYTIILNLDLQMTNWNLKLKFEPRELHWRAPSRDQQGSLYSRALLNFTEDAPPPDFISSLSSLCPLTSAMMSWLHLLASKMMLSLCKLNHMKATLKFMFMLMPDPFTRWSPGWSLCPCFCLNPCPCLCPCSNPCLSPCSAVHLVHHFLTRMFKIPHGKHTWCWEQQFPTALLPPLTRYSDHTQLPLILPIRDLVFIYTKQYQGLHIHTYTDFAWFGI